MTETINYNSRVNNYRKKIPYAWFQIQKYPKKNPKKIPKNLKSSTPFDRVINPTNFPPFFRYPTNDHHQPVEQNQRLPQKEATKRRRESRIVEWVPEVPGHHHDLSRDHNNGTTWWHKGHGHDTWSECAVPWWRYVSIQMWNAGTILVSFFVWN